MAAKAAKQKPILAIDGVPTAEGLVKAGLARRSYDSRGNEKIQISRQGYDQIKTAQAASAERTIREGNHRGISNQFDYER